MRTFDKCPRCGCDLVRSKNIAGTDSEFWFECTSCNTYVNTYIPQEHQESYHSDAHKFKGNFGGFGTGKTTTSREQFYKHMFITPNGNSLIGANISAQYEQTIKRDIENDLPAAFVADMSVQKQYFDFINGHRLIFRPLDDQGKLRSYNLTMFVVVEASEVDAEIFSQLKTRLRNMRATLPRRDANGNIVYSRTSRGVLIPEVEYDWREGIIESNPDSGWVRTDVLMVSDTITTYGTVTDEYIVPDADKDEAVSSHIAATDINQFLPPGFIRENTKNKPPWWVARYIKGSFAYSEGLVYPNAMRCVIPSFSIPKEWKRLVAFDYGLTDAADYVCAAVDEANGELHIYKEARTSNRNIEELAKLYFDVISDIPSGGMLGQPIIDPKSGPKRDYNKKTLGDHFLDFGISFKPGYVNIDARIFRLNTYIESHKLKIHDCCLYLIEELKGYKFPDKKLGKHTPDKPVDKDNHSINPLEWIVMELPADPGRIVYGVYNKFGRDVTKPINYNDYDPYSEDQENPDAAYNINMKEFV